MRHRFMLWLQKYQVAFIIAIALVLFYAVTYMLGASCLVKYLLGVSCPGCGMTRACLSALMLDFSAAFYYHPLWIVMPPLAVLLIFLWAKRKKKAFFAVLALFFLALIGVYLYRLFYTETDIVACEIEKGMIYKFLNKSVV